MTDLIPEISGRRVFMTGASGFIGRHLLGALNRAGAKVTIWSRSRRAAALPPNLSAHVAVGDLRDTVKLQRALQNQEVVFNLAYDGRATARSNFDSFDSLYSAAKAAGVARFVHTSSIVVYDNWPTLDIDEDGTMDRPGGGPYRQAKIEMERRLMKGEMPAVILQPTIVYGPGSALWTDQFAEQLKAGGVVLPSPEGLCNGVYVDDVVQALLRAAVVPQQQERFIISGPSPFKWSELLEGYASILGAGAVHYVPIKQLQERLGPESDSVEEPDVLSPVIRAYAVGHRIFGRERFERLIRFVKRRVAGGGRAYPDHHLLGVFGSSGLCSIERARTRLGFEPAYDLSRGLAKLETYLAP